MDQTGYTKSPFVESLWSLLMRHAETEPNNGVVTEHHCAAVILEIRMERYGRGTEGTIGGGKVKWSSQDG